MISPKSLSEVAFCNCFTSEFITVYCLIATSTSFKTSCIVVSLISNIDLGSSVPIPTLYELVIVFAILSTLNILFLLESFTKRLPLIVLSPVIIKLWFNIDFKLNPEPIKYFVPLSTVIVLTKDIFRNEFHTYVTKDDEFIGLLYNTSS